MSRQRPSHQTTTVKFLTVVAQIMLGLHAIAGAIVGLVTVGTVIAALGASSQMEEDAVQAAATGTMMPVLFALVPIAAIILSAVPWGMILLLCQIANDVAQLKGTAQQATTNARTRHSEAQEALNGIWQHSAATSERLQKATTKRKSRTNGNPAEPPKRSY